MGREREREKGREREGKTERVENREEEKVVRGEQPHEIYARLRKQPEKVKSFQQKESDNQEPC